MNGTITKIELAVFAMLLVVCTAVGYSFGAARAGQVFTEYKLQQRTASETAALATLAELQNRQRHADALTRELTDARQAATLLKQERQNAIERHTDNRACLRDPALRLLDGAPGLRVSEAAGGADGADAAHVATDRDLARWALDAGDRYAECVRRLDALIQWIEGEDGAKQ